MSDYSARLLRVIDHIHANPSVPLTVDDLADVACLSRFHFHRVFRVMTGETVGQTVRRLRLTRAAIFLVTEDWPLAQIAQAVGFSDRTTFSRAFEKLHGMSPSDFRKRGRVIPHAACINGHPKGSKMYNVETRETPELRLAVLSHVGPYETVAESFEKLNVIMGTGNHWPMVRGMVGLYLDDPDAVPAAELRSYAAVIWAGDDVPDGLEEMIIPAGRAGVLTYKGPYSNIKAAYDYLWGDWLGKSGGTPADVPAIEYYLNSPMDTKPEDLLTEIWLPLA